MKGRNVQYVTMDDVIISKQYSDAEVARLSLSSLPGSFWAFDGVHIDRETAERWVNATMLVSTIKKESAVPLFEVAILETATKNDADNGVGDKLVFGITPVVAKDEQAAIAVALSQAALKADPNRLKVLVRPFVKA